MSDALLFDPALPRNRAREFEYDLARKDPDTGVPSPLPATSSVRAWLSLAENGQPITDACVVVLVRRALELRDDKRRLWFGVLDRDAVSDALDGIDAGETMFEVVEVDGERESAELTVED